MRVVIASITGQSGQELNYLAHHWLNLLAPREISGLLRRCSHSLQSSGAHQFHARAFVQPGSAPAWERIRELERSIPKPSAPAREREQKFGILWSSKQARRDFDGWAEEAQTLDGYQIGVLFIDVDNFKLLNSTLTESVVDKTILPDLQRLLASSCLHRGAAYRHGGEEFIVLLPNQTLEESASFAEALRERVEQTFLGSADSPVRVTLSIGVASWPIHGSGLDAVIERANREEHRSKSSGRNMVCVAGPTLSIGDKF